MPAEAMRPPPDKPGEELGLAKGATIGRYVVLGLLGRGGMGEVYAAYDPELDRKIAVKLLRARGGAAAASADASTRLLREAQAIARLSHPNVVVVYDVGTFNQSVFIAMEFVEGHTLGYWLAAATRRWREVLEVFTAAGRGLVAAHAAGLVHRDFKPENVMLTKSGQVRVMDFGLAREHRADEPSPAGKEADDAAARAAALADTFGPELDPDATAKLGGADAGAEVPAGSGGYLRLKLTATGAILGTPAYMSPEQFAGASGDARADQFSFCVALYEGLYGQRPFAGENALALMANVVSGAVRDPPADTKVPAWIRKVLMRGLATSPDDRFPSMTALLAALAQDPAARRRRLAATAGGVIALAAVAAGAQRFSAGQRALCAGGPSRLGAAWSPARRVALARAFERSGSRNARAVLASVVTLFDRYAGRWTAMYRETCEATQVRGEQSAEVLDLRMTCLGERLSSLRALGDVLVAADPGIVDNAVGAASALPTLDRCADVAMLRAVIKPPDDPGKRAEVTRLQGEVAKVGALASAGRCKQAKALGAPLYEEAKRLGYRPLEAESGYALGSLVDTCLEPAEAVDVLEDAVLSGEASNHAEMVASASTALAVVYLDRLPDARLSRYWVKHAEATLARLPGHPVLEAWVSLARANALKAEGKFEAALAEDRRALALKEAALGPLNVDTTISVYNVALDLHDLGRDAEAAELARRAVESFQRLGGDDNARVALALSLASESLTAIGRFDEARAAIDRALAIWRESGAGSFYVGYGLLDAGRLDLAAHRPKAAREELEQALRLLGNDSGGVVADAEFALARALWTFPRERARAGELCAKARGVAAGKGASPADARRLAELDAWLAAHPRPEHALARAETPD